MQFVEQTGHTERSEVSLGVVDTLVERKDEDIHNMEVMSQEDRDDRDGVKRKYEEDLVLFLLVSVVIHARDSSVMIMQALGIL